MERSLPLFAAFEQTVPEPTPLPPRMDPPPDDRPPRKLARDTQRAARQRNSAGKQARAVLDFLSRRGPHGATDEEIAIELSIRLNSAGARRCELRDRGLAVDSGRRRETSSGSLAAVWVLAGPGSLDPAPLPARNDRTGVPSAMAAGTIDNGGPDR